MRNEDNIEIEKLKYELYCKNQVLNQHLSLLDKSKCAIRNKKVQRMNNVLKSANDRLKNTCNLYSKRELKYINDIKIYRRALIATIGFTISFTLCAYLCYSLLLK